MKTIIHIGPPRTATTLLQKQLFDKHPDILYLGYLRTARVDACHKKVLVISDEYIVTRAASSNTYREMFSGLKDAFPEGELFFSLRNQLDAIVSHYSSSAYYKDKILDTAINRADNFYNYLNMYNLACEYFGQTNVHFVFFESLRSDFQEYCRCLNNILGIDDSISYLDKKIENIRKSDLRMKMEAMPKVSKKIVPRAVRRFVSDLADRYTSRSKTVLNHSQQARIRKIFAESNTEFAKLTDTLDVMQKFGYPL